MEKECLVNMGDIENKLHELFKMRLDIEIKNQDDLLFGSNVGLSARDLVYICLDIEKEFGITFDDDCIENYDFTTFASIKQFIYSKLNKATKCTA